MDIADIQDVVSALDDFKAADLQVFTDDENLLLQRGGDVELVVVGLREQVFDAYGLGLQDDLRDIRDEALELVAHRDEVGLGVDLEDDGVAAALADRGVDDTLGGDAAGLLLRGGQTLFTQEFDRLIKIAFGLSQRLLALHHADASHFAQMLYVFSGNCHSCSPPSKIESPYAFSSSPDSSASAFSAEPASSSEP